MPLRGGPQPSSTGSRTPPDSRAAQMNYSSGDTQIMVNHTQHDHPSATPSARLHGSRRAMAAKTDGELRSPITASGGAFLLLPPIAGEVDPHFPARCRTGLTPARLLCRKGPGRRSPWKAEFLGSGVTAWNFGGGQLLEPDLRGLMRIAGISRAATRVFLWRWARFSLRFCPARVFI